MPRAGGIDDRVKLGVEVYLDPASAAKVQSGIRALAQAPSRTSVSPTTFAQGQASLTGRVGANIAQTQSLYGTDQAISNQLKVFRSQAAQLGQRIAAEQARLERARIAQYNADVATAYAINRRRNAQDAAQVRAGDQVLRYRAQLERRATTAYGRLAPGAAASDRASAALSALDARQYAAVAAAAQKAGLSVTEFAKRKFGATQAEARNEQQLRGLISTTNRATGAFGQMGRVLRSLAVAFVGFQAFRGIQHALADMVEFQSTLQQVKLGVAEVLLVGSRFRDQITGAVLAPAQQVQQAFQMAARATQSLVERAVQFGVPLDDLVKTYQIAAGLAQQSNISQKETLDIVTQISVLAQRLSIPYTQVSRSIDNILLGQKTQITQLGRILQLDDATAQSLIAQGKYGQFLLDRLQGVAATLPENLNTFEGIRRSVRSIILDLSRRVGAGAFESLQTALREMRDTFLELRDPKNVETLERYAQSIKDIADSLISGTREMARFIAEHRRLIGALAGAAAGYRVGGIPGAVIGGAAGSGLIGLKTAGLAAAGIAGGHLLSSGVAALAGGAGATLGGAAAAAASALGGLTIPILAVGAALYGLAKLIERLNQGPAAPSPLTATQVSERAAGEAFGIAGRLQQQLTPENIARLNRYARLPRYRSLAEAESQQVRDAIDLLENNLAKVIDPERRQRLESYVEEFRGLATRLEVADPFGNFLKEFEKQTIAEKKSQQLAQARLAVEQATRQATEQTLEAQAGIVRAQLSLLDEVQRGRQLSLELSEAQGQRAFATGPGASRAAAQARISGIQARIGTLQQYGALAGSRGDLGSQQAAQQEQFRLERQLLDERRTILQTETQQQDLQARTIQGRIDAEQHEVTNVLPERLRLEREILGLQVAQADAKAKSASSELALIDQQIALIDKRAAELAAREKAAGQTDPRVQEQRDQLEIQRLGFQREQYQKRGEIDAAAASRRALGIQGDALTQRYENEVQQRRVQQAQQEGELANIANERKGTEQEINNLADEHTRQLYEQTQTYQQLVDQSDQLRSNMANWLADIIEGNDFLKTTEALFKRINRAGAEDLGNILLGRSPTNNSPIAQIFGGARGAPNGEGGSSLSGISNLVGGVQKLFGGGGGASAGGFGGVLGGLFGGGAGAATGAGGAAAAGSGGFTAGYGGASSVIGGTSAFGSVGAGGVGSSGVGAISGGAAAGAGGYGAIIYAAIALASSIAKSNEVYKSVKYDITQTRREVLDKSVNAGVQTLVGSILSLYGLGGLSKSLGKAFGKIGNATLSNPDVKAALLNPLGSTIATTAELFGLFQAPTAGPIIAKYLRKALVDIGLTRNATFGGGNVGVATNLRIGGANGPQYALPASFTPEFLQRSLGLAAPVATNALRGVPRGDIRNALPTGVQASILAAASGLGLGTEDTLDLQRQLGQQLVGSFQKGAIQILATSRRRRRFTRQQAAEQIVGLYDVFNELSPAIDRASLALTTFGRDGTISLKALQRAADDVQKVVVEGIPGALQAAIKSGQPYDAATTLATNFADTFASRVGERLLQQSTIGAALTKATTLAGQAAEALVQGDTARYAQLIAQARQAYTTGSTAALTAINNVLGPITSFQSSLGVYPGGTGVINPTGAGLPGFATPTSRRTPGPVGLPRLGMFHGEEVVRSGEQNDAMVRAQNKQAEAIAMLASALAQRGKDGGGDVHVYLHTGDVVREVRTAEKRDATGQGIRTPNATVGVA